MTVYSSNRNSNIELLRIIAMLMILVLHMDFLATGEPTTEQALLYPLQTFGKVFFEMLSLISVNLFVLISGWFTIKTSIKGGLKFLYQCIFIITLMYLIGLAIGATEFSTKGVLECVFMADNAWFVKSYLGLYILAPILNVYAERVTKKQLLTTLIIFYSFQTLYGCLFYSVDWIAFGNSAFSFVGLYLLARYIRLYCTSLFKFGFWLWIGALIVATSWYWLPLRFGYLSLSYMALHYSSPTTIIGALGLLIWMASKPERHNKFINVVAASCFTVYLYHICNSWTSSIFCSAAKNIFEDYSGMQYFLIASLFIISVFCGGIIIDQLRKFSWNIMQNIFNYSGKTIR